MTKLEGGVYDEPDLSDPEETKSSKSVNLLPLVVSRTMKRFCFAIISFDSGIASISILFVISEDVILIANRIISPFT